MPTVESVTGAMESSRAFAASLASLAPGLIRASRVEKAHRGDRLPASGRSSASAADAAVLRRLAGGVRFRTRPRAAVESLRRPGTGSAAGSGLGPDNVRRRCENSSHEDHAVDGASTCVGVRTRSAPIAAKSVLITQSRTG
jgi:hypothetical protein